MNEIDARKERGKRGLETIFASTDSVYMDNYGSLEVHPPDADFPHHYIYIESDEPWTGVGVKPEDRVDLIYKFAEALGYTIVGLNEN